MNHTLPMRYDQKPMYRRLIVPWYDSRTVCILVIVFMLAVIIFAAIGIRVAVEYPEHLRHAWVPALLLVMGLFVVASTAVRLIKRWKYRY